MHFKKIAVSALLLGLGAYIWLPTADELFIHPTLGLFFSFVFGINIAYGVLLSILVYRGIGTLCILGALLLGGKPIYEQLLMKLKKRNLNK